MSEQQYRVVADMTSMADDSWITEGDRVTYGSVSSTGELVIFRIERPVPAIGEQWDKIDALTREWRQAIITDDEYSEAVRALLPSPHPPTREQIAEVIHGGLAHRGFDLQDDDTAHLTDALLALIQNGAEQ